MAMNTTFSDFFPRGFKRHRYLCKDFVSLLCVEMLMDGQDVLVSLCRDQGSRSRDVIIPIMSHKQCSDLVIGLLILLTMWIKICLQ